MKVTVERAALLRSLGHVHRVVERRNTIPILSNILIRADNSSLRLKATDLDLEVTENFAADVEQAGATTIPAYMLYDIIRKLPDGAQVSLEMNGLRCKRFPIAIFRTSQQVISAIISLCHRLN